MARAPRRASERPTVRAADPDREALAAAPFRTGRSRPRNTSPSTVRDMVGFTYDEESFADAGPRRVAARGRAAAARAPMSAPAWAGDLVATVCADAGVPPPRLLWRVRRGGPSTGVARRSDGTISVRAGTDPLDQRLTLLHELAHWIAPAARRRGRRSVHHGRGLLRGRLRSLPPPRHGRRGCAAAGVRALPIGPGPRRRPRRPGCGRRAWPSIGRGCERVRGGNGACSCPSMRSGSSETGAGRSAPSAVSGWSGRICARVQRSRRPVRHVLMTAVRVARL